MFAHDTEAASTNDRNLWMVTKDQQTTFCFSDTWSSSAKETCVSMSFDDEALYLEYVVEGDEIQRNAFTKCDAEVYNQEVVEVFLTNNTYEEKPEHYWEVELTPTGVVWFGYDSNPGGDRQNFSNTLYPCDLIEARVVSSSTNRWIGTMRLPFDVVGQGTQDSDLCDALSRDRCLRYRANFFRVQMDPSWETLGRNITVHDTCSPENCTFSCAKCPTTEKPDFHHSGFFGDLVLVS